MANYMSGNRKQTTSSAEYRHGRQLRSQTSGNTSGNPGGQGPKNEDLSSCIRQLTDTVQERNEELRKEKHRSSSLSGELRKLRNDYRISTQEIAKLKKTYSRMVNRYHEVLRDVVIPYARSKDLRIDKQTGEAIDNVLEPLLRDAMQAHVLRNHVQALQRHNHEIQGHIETVHQRKQDLQAETTALRKQVTDLQQDALGRIKQVQVVSDSQFERDFQVLASSIKTFSRSIQSAERLDVAKVIYLPSFLEDVPSHHWQGRARKKTFVEAWTWAVLVKAVFCDPFAVFRDDIGHVKKAWQQMFGSDHDHEWPSPSSSCESWRRSTVEHLRDSINRASRHDDTMEPAPKRTKTVHTDPCKQLAVDIEMCLKQFFPETNFSQVRIIVDKAIALAVQMSLQRCRLQITYPSTGCKFIEGMMASVPDRDEEDVDAGVVAFIINPGLTKWGDAHGEKLDERYDIVPSLVQLEQRRIRREDGVDRRGIDTNSSAGCLDAPNVLLPQYEAGGIRQMNMPAIKQEKE
ncbi:unnamed protein product [Alternaria alternata]